MLSAPSSEQIQRWFFALLCDQRPLEEALAALALSEPSVLPLTNWIVAPDEASARRRLEIYCGMRFARLLESLEQDFRSARAALGAAGFERLVRAYAAAYPSRSPSLRDFGAALPEFVRELERASSQLNTRADLADLCALDWARLDMFDCADSKPLELAELAAIAPGDWARERVALVPAHSFVCSEHAIEHVWLALERDQAVPEPNATAETLFVWKRAFDVRHRAIDAAEHALLQELARGMSLADLCARLALGASEHADQLGASILARLRQYIHDGLLVRSAGTAVAP